MRHVLLTTCVALLGPACATVPAPRTEPPIEVPSVAIPDLEGRLAELTVELERQRETNHVAGMAIAVVKDDAVVYARGFGLADLENGAPVTPETLFAIGSTTKAFTVNCIGMLVDEGRMSWDDPITAYLPAFELAVEDASGAPGVVTVRDLLCHRTGFTRMGILWGAGTADRATILETATAADSWSPFREAFFYNNVMYLAAGEAAGAVAEESWDELVTERLLQPLGMDSSSTTIRVAQEDPRLALGYLWNEELEEYDHKPMRNLHAIAPAGAINSNVLDMAQWVRLQLARGSLEGERLIGSERIAETWTSQIELGPGVDYGLGWFLREWNGQRAIEHGGNIDGFSAAVELLPDSGLGFVLLMNVSASPLQQSARSVVWDVLLGEREEPAVELAEAEGDSLDDYLGIYIANYAQFVNERFEVKLQNDRLAIHIPTQMTFELLEPDAEGKRPIAIAPAALQASFERDEAGDVVLLKFYQNGLVFEVPREGAEIPPDGTEEDFARYYGAYRHPLLGQPVTLVYRNGRLACDVPEQMVFELRLPDDEDVWHFRASDELGIQFIEDEAGAVDSLVFLERGTETICQRVEEGAVQLPTTDEILALRKAAAVGEAIDAYGSMRFTGSTHFANAGVVGEIVATFDSAGRFLQETSFPPFGWSWVGYDGTTGWTHSAFNPHEELEGKLLDQLKLSHPAVFFGDWSRHFDSVQVVRATTYPSGHLAWGEDEEDLRLWVVRLTKGDLPAWSAYVDAQTGDLVRVDSQLIVPGVGRIPQTTYLEDHRPLDVWTREEGPTPRIPRVIITESDSNGRVVTTFETIETGFEIAPDAFAPRKQ